MRRTISLPDDLSDLVEIEARRRRTSVSAVIRELVAAGLTGMPGGQRSVPWAGLINDPGMVRGDRIDDELAEGWADDIDRDRG